MSPEATSEYGTWSAQRDSLRIDYSLPLFHEIDFAVSESYRRIPHGGIEIGGLLFGRSEPGRVRIDLFRPIHCEHALGPSFKLSDADLSALRAQVENAHTDSELRDLELVGWFISHTRSGLAMNEAELRIFNDILPGEGKLTLLIKPEKFKPTLFAFLARTASGELTEEGAQNPVLLPLTGRANGDNAPAAAPSVMPATPATVPEPPAKPASPAPPPIKTEPPKSSEDQISAVKKALLAARQMSVEAPEPVPPTGPIRTPLSRLERYEPPSERKAPLEARQGPITEARQGPITTRRDVPAPMPPPPQRPPLPAAPWPDEIYSAGAISQGAQWSNRMRPLPAGPEPGSRSGLQFALVMLLSAALGCGLGYWAYLQLPSAIIALDIRPEASGLLLSWPPEQTRDSPYAAIRINDGEPVPLSPTAKVAGQSRIEVTADDVKVEIIAQHWMRTSRGIVRYLAPVRPAVQPPQTAPMKLKSKRRMPSAGNLPADIAGPNSPSRTALR